MNTRITTQIKSTTMSELSRWGFPGPICANIEGGNFPRNCTNKAKLTCTRCHLVAVSPSTPPHRFFLSFLNPPSIAAQNVKRRTGRRINWIAAAPSPKALGYQPGKRKRERVFLKANPPKLKRQNIYLEIWMRLMS